MARTAEQAKKYAAIKAPNGYEFDFVRYLYGGSIGDEFPSWKKVLSEDDEKTTYKRVYFFKYWDKSAAVYVETFSLMKNGGRVQIINRNPGYSEKIVEKLPQGTRYSPKLLFPYCD